MPVKEAKVSDQFGVVTQNHGSCGQPAVCNAVIGALREDIHELKDYMRDIREEQKKLWSNGLRVLSERVSSVEVETKAMQRMAKSAGNGDNRGGGVVVSILKMFPPWALVTLAMSQPALLIIGIWLLARGGGQ